MTNRTLSRITGISYLVIFFAAIFANFFVLESMLKSPIESIQAHQMTTRAGIMAFMVTVVFDVVVAWSLYALYKNHWLSVLSACFRMMHAAIMGVAVFALVVALRVASAEEVLAQVHVFNTIWLIGLFFFGIHLVLLGNIIGKPKVIAWFLILAGLMYVVDTAAHFMLPNYESYSAVFLALVAIPSVVGEMSFAVWLLVKGGQE